MEEVVTGGSIFSPALPTNAGVVGLEKAGPKHADNLANGAGHSCLEKARIFGKSSWGCDLQSTANLLNH